MRAIITLGLFTITSTLAFGQNKRIHITDSINNNGVKVEEVKGEPKNESKEKKIDLYFDSKQDIYIIGEVNGIYHAKWSGTSWQKSEKIGNRLDSLLKSDSIIVCKKIPVELLSFSVSKKGMNVDLNWATGMEENNDYFTLERSSDNVKYTEIGKVKAAVNSTEIKNYHFTDTAPENGVNFYRLKHMDQKAECSYPEVRAIYVNRIKDADAKLFIDKLDGETKLSYESRNGENFQIKVIDHKGKVVFGGFIPSMPGKTVVNLDFAKFEKDVYFIYLTDPKNNVTILEYNNK